MKVEIWASVANDGEIDFTTVNEVIAKEWSARGFLVVKLEGELPEPKKTVLMAKALVRGHGSFWPSGVLYRSEKDAKSVLGDGFVCWPAPVPNAEGFYEIEVEK